MANPMDIYEGIKKIGPEAKAEADAFMAGLTEKYTEKNPAPKELIQEGLEGILAKYTSPKSHVPNQQPKTSPGLFNLTQSQSAVGLAAVLAGIVILSGIYVPPPL